MKNREINRQLQALNDLLKKTDEATKGSLELQSHWAKYVCILSSGLIENSLKEVYSEFVKNASSQPVANYTCSILKKVQNPKATRFVETARMFKVEWANELECHMEEEGRADAINSIMSNRHLIAHGKSSGITLTRVKEYLGKAIEVIEFIEEQCST